MVRTLGWLILAFGGGWLVWHFARHRYAVGAVGLGVAVLGGLLGAIAGRKLELAERIDHRLEELFGDVEVDDISTWVPTLAGAALLLAIYIAVRTSGGRRRHDGAAILPQQRTTKDGSL